MEAVVSTGVPRLAVKEQAHLILPELMKILLMVVIFQRFERVQPCPPTALTSCYQAPECLTQCVAVLATEAVNGSLLRREAEMAQPLLQKQKVLAAVVSDMARWAWQESREPLRQRLRVEQLQVVVYLEAIHRRDRRTH